MSQHHIISIFFMFCTTCAIVRAQCNVEGYYWRDFTGEIPLDALPGGTDVNAKPIYIGQVLDPARRYLIPAKIYVHDPRAYYEHSWQELNETSNVKILCTQRPEHFEWIKTNTNDIKLLTDKHLVLGGYEPGCTTYIGRARQEGEVLVGKALADNHPDNQGLHLTSNGKKTIHKSFEVLSFNPTALDVRAVWNTK